MAFLELLAEPLRDGEWPEIRRPSLASGFPGESASTGDRQRGIVSATSLLSSSFFFSRLWETKG